MVMQRRTWLAVSIALSVVVHLGVVAVAPSILMSHTGPGRAQKAVPFRVELWDNAVPLPMPSEPAQAESESLASRPGSVKDLLKRESERIQPAPSLTPQAVDIPQVAERAAADVLERQHDLAPQPDLLKEVDAQVVEISEARARQDIQVTRRLVTPSSTRIVGENEYPALRGEPGEGNAVLVLRPQAPDFAPNVAAMNSDAAGPASSAGPLEPILERPVTLDDSNLLPESEPRARVAVKEQISQDRPYAFMDDLVDVSLESYRPADGGPGYFRLHIAPKKDADIAPIPKCVTFIVDASASIIQRKLDLATEGLRKTIAQLRPTDRFNVVVFRDTPSFFRPEPVLAAPDNKAAATAFLTGLKAGGETDVFRAVQPIVQSPTNGMPGMVILVTDGRPTKGFIDARTIINELTADNARRVPVFAFGGGNTVNAYLLDLLTYLNRGESYLIQDLDRYSGEIAKQCGRIDAPVLINCRANYSGIEPNSVYPRELLDFYAGKPMTVYGRFDPRKDKEFVMRLTGVTGGKSKEVIFKADLSKASAGPAEIARQWAFQRIYFLIGEVCRDGERPELISEIRKLGAAHNVKTIYNK